MNDALRFATQHFMKKMLFKTLPMILEIMGQMTLTAARTPLPPASADDKEHARKVGEGGSHASIVQIQLYGLSIGSQRTLVGGLVWPHQDRWWTNRTLVKAHQTCSRVGVCSPGNRAGWAERVF
jgi:hypothetical protein